MVMSVKEADLPESTPIRIELKKNSVKNDIPPNSTNPSTLSAPGRNPKKVVEFWEKWRPFIPQQCHEEMCIKPSADEVEAGKKGAKEKGSQAKKTKGKKRKMKQLEVAAAMGGGMEDDGGG